MLSTVLASLLVLAPQADRAVQADALRADLSRSVRFHPMSRSAMRKFVVDAKAGNDVDEPVTFSASRMVVPGGSMVLDGNMYINPVGDFVSFHLKPYEDFTARLELEHLKKGAKYLVTADLVFAGPDGDTPVKAQFSGAGKSATTTGVVGGENNLAFVYAATGGSASLALTLTDTDHKDPGFYYVVKLSTIEIRLIK